MATSISNQAERKKKMVEKLPVDGTRIRGMSHPGRLKFIAWRVHPGNAESDSRTALSVFSHQLPLTSSHRRIVRVARVLMVEQLHETWPIIRPWNVDLEISGSMCLFFPGTTGLAGRGMSSHLLAWVSGLKPMSLWAHILGSGDLFCLYLRSGSTGRTFPLFLGGQISGVALQKDEKLTTVMTQAVIFLFI